MLKFTGTSNIRHFVVAHLRARGDLRGKVAVDIPAGTGAMSAVLRECGAEVRAFDLFPEFFDVPGLTCERADMTESIPMPDGSADFVLFQEGIEHVPDQLATLREMNRILKPGGVLILTTPNISNLRARVAMLFTESELSKHMAPNELDDTWHASDGRMYFGHIFLIGVNRLRALAAIAGFEFRTLHTVRASGTSLMLAPLAPLVIAAGWYAYWWNMRTGTEAPADVKRRVYSEIRKINASPGVLFGKKLFIEFRKARSADYEHLRVYRRESKRADSKEHPANRPAESG